jgi:hypothetical protein
MTFEDYWNSICDSGILKDALRDAFEAGERHAMDYTKQEWFDNGFEAGVKAAKKEMDNNVHLIDPNPPTIDEWKKQQANK